MSEIVVQPQKKRKKRLIIFLLMFIVIGTAIGGYYYKYYQEEKAKQYADSFQATMLSITVTGSTAEEMANKYKSVWYDTIFENYGTVAGERYTNFNSAITAQKKVFDQHGYIDDLEDELEETEQLIKQLSNPPKEYEEEYELMLELYPILKQYSELALSPSGSLETYSDEVNELNDDIASKIYEINIRLDN